MLNAEKWKKEILDITERGYYFAVSKDGQNIVRSCDGLRCENCIFDEGDRCDCGCNYSRMKWMLSEYKEPIKLSRLEHELLKFINNEGYKYIARDNCGGVLFRYPEKPTKNIYGEWGKGGICSDLRMFNDLFQFVKWEDEEPTLIADILKNCEVVNDAEE